jgi:hypothetical protein
MPDDLFDKPKIELAFAAVAARLEAEDAAPEVVVVVGGSFMALHELRESTLDVDIVTPLTSSIRSAVLAVAEEHDFASEWLNDQAARFSPAGLRESDCGVLFDHPRLRVLGPPPKYVFVMKLFAARGPDYDDMVALWSRCDFASADEAVAFYREAYPNAPDDTYLVSYVETIATEARGFGSESV